MTKFGFEAERHPPYLTMALGAGSVTPLSMASAYGVFATGGHLVQPVMISRVTDHQGRVLLDIPPTPVKDAPQVIAPRNAFVMGSLLQEITRSGTAAKAQATLKRPDLYGKTGTTNDAMDAWFVGYQPTIVAAVWVGYDNPRNLGSRETGGGLSLPIWISFMQEALKGVPVMEAVAPEGVSFRGGDWHYDEFGPGNGVGHLGTGAEAEGASANPSQRAPLEADERKGILDLFRN